jgi:hypothetical protein
LQPSGAIGDDEAMKPPLVISLLCALLAFVNAVAFAQESGGAPDVKSRAAQGSEAAQAESKPAESKPAKPELPDVKSAQEPSQDLPSIAELAGRMRSELRDKRSPARIEGFRTILAASFRIEDGSTVRLHPHIWYRRSPLALRVETKENGKEIIFVRSGRQIWLKNQDRVIDLSAKKEYARDRENANLYFRIARMVPRLLYPDQALLNAKRAKGPELVSWRMTSKSKARSLYRVSWEAGLDERYPLQSVPSHKGPLMLAMLVEPKSARPYAYIYFGVDEKDGRKVTALEDLIFLRPQRLKNGIVLPTEWIKRVEDPKSGDMKLVQEWRLESFVANPQFDVTLFEKPK